MSGAPTKLGHIQLLSSQVANAIAAGEVVERPASVVKELCENSLDAGAQSINIELEGGGTTRICVVDDGCGIAGDELGLAVARHATSKITAVSDLGSIHTLGFRGEALASMAAVSDLRIRSTPAGGASGRQLRVRGGEVTGDENTPPAPGTEVELCDLFFNTPARLQFLRTPKAETSRSVRVISDLALANPAVRFSCKVDGRSVLRTNGGSLLDGISAVFWTNDAGGMLPVDYQGDIGVSGYVGQPHRHRGQRGGMVTMVNGRRVHNRMLTVAVQNAFSSLVPTGRFPICVLQITVPTDRIDVNVHPAKTEIRFADERQVFSAIEKACWNALNNVTLAPAAEVWAPVLAAVEVRPHAELTFADANMPPATWTPAAPDDDGTNSGASLASLAPLHAVGQINGQWLVAQSQVGLVVVDPHAAHEKLLYTQLMKREANAIQTQLLLVPATVELTPEQMTYAGGALAELAEWGIEVEEFGPQTLRCTGLPALATRVDAQKLVTEMLDELAAPASSAGQKKHRAAALMACHSAVRLGDRLDGAEQQRLLDDLVAEPRATTCPHGRPTVFVMDDSTLRRTFARPQL